MYNPFLYSVGIRHYFRFIYLRCFSLDRWYHILFFIKCDYSLQFEMMKLTFNNKITTIEKKYVMYICRKQFCMEKYQRVSSYYGNLLTYISYCFIKIKILNWIARFKNLQLVGEKWPNSPNKFIYMGMTYRYSVMGIIGLRHEVSIFTGRQPCWYLGVGDEGEGGRPCLQAPVHLTWTAYARYIYN